MFKRLKRNESKILTFLLVISFLLVVKQLNANTIYLDWHKHKNTTCSDSTITGWHSLSTERLCSDDAAGDLDVSCNTAITKSGSTDETWEYTGGDEIILSAPERDDAFKGMTKTCAVVTRIAIAGTGKGEWGWHSGGKILVATLCSGVGYLPGVVIAHEVGHKVGITGDYDPGIEKRIMNAQIGGSEDRVIESEKDQYEGFGG